MKFVIKKLSPELSEDYLHFFDSTPHDDEVAEHKCYCVCQSSTNAENADDTTAEKRRYLASEYINKNYIQGYLAYDNEQIVGWCNSNAKYNCLKSRSGSMYFEKRDIDETSDGLKVKSVFCFVIAPEMRRKGIAGQLLDKVCEDAAKDGFDCVEAYPLKEFVSTQIDYMGPVKLYEKHGFVTHFDYGDRLVVRKMLK